MESGPILKAFPFLQKPGLEEEVLTYAMVLKAAAGEVFIRQGQYLKVLPLLIRGSMRVIQQSDEREILLYAVRPGETCIMSLSSCFFNTPSPSQAIIDAPSEILCIPAGLVREWQRKYDSWNEFVIRTFQGRYNELLDLFSNVVFTNIETRIVHYLSTCAAQQQTKHIPVTHLALANALGTTRVVVSRILKRFEEEGRVKLQRSHIEIIRL